MKESEKNLKKKKNSFFISAGKMPSLAEKEEDEY